MSIKDGKNAEQVEAERREMLARREREEWVQLARVYRRCVEIAENVWGTKLEKASAQQQTLAEQMRNRSLTTYGGTVGDVAVHDRGIPVPLFTPRDRQQFLKEVATTLLISADRRNLTVQFPKESVTDAPEKPEAPEAVEAGSGVDETALDNEARELAETGPA